MLVLVAHPGTQHAFRLARELERHALLHQFWTGVAFAESTLLARTARAMRGLPAVGGLCSRIVPGIGSARLHTLPRNEIRALIELRMGRESHGVLHRRNATFQSAIPEKNLAESDAIIGFDTSSWILAQRAAALDRPLYLDRSIGHPSFMARSLTALQRQYPAWQTPSIDRPGFVADAEAIEHQRAHRIVVGSAFARETLIDAGIAAHKIHVNPYGVDWDYFATSPTSVPPGGPTHRPIRFAFVGSIIARKGVPVLLDAWRRLDGVDAELWLVGSCGPRERAIIPPLPGMRILGRVPHTNLPRLFAEIDVLVLPSIVEGFSLVLLEALAAGLAVVATPNTGATDILADSRLGRLVPPASADALESAFRHYISNPPLREMICSAAAPLAERYSWTAYGDRWAELLLNTR